MKSFDQAHLLLLIATVTFIASTMFAAYKLPRWFSTSLFIVGALVCSGGIFWRYAMNLSLELVPLRWDTLAIQMLQVCNFNFILLPLMLVPRFELARQYSFMFSMFAAATVMLTIPSRYASSEWYSPDFLNFWLNHVFAIALPLWMLAAKRLKPKKEYIIPVSICVIVYFLAVYGCTEWLHASGKLPESTTFSYVYDPKGVALLEWLYKLIPTPCFYLAPLIPPMLGFFWLLTWLFRNYKTTNFSRPTPDTPPTDPAYPEYPTPPTTTPDTPDTPDTPTDPTDPTPP